MIKAFPKIFAIGTDYIKDLFKDKVEITEKIDGSQFVFGKIGGEFFMRSKGKQIFPEAPDKMFQKAVDYVIEIQDKIPDNAVIYSEYLQNPRHNVLEYARVPKNNLILFGISTASDKFEGKYENLEAMAKKLDIECVPIMGCKKIKSADELLKYLETESILGSMKVEGVVCKNYHQAFLLGGQPIPIMMGKYVSEKYKEVHRNWGKEHTSKGRWGTFKESFKTEARWQKAIQHLKEKGELENSPRDIGKLINEIKKDIGEEEKETIKDFLWKEFGDEVLRYSTGGFPEWYKERLLKRSF